MSRLVVEIRPYVRRLRTPLRSARGSVDARVGLHVRLRDADGPVGCGEIAPIAWMGEGTVADCHEALVGALGGSTVVESRVLEVLAEVDLPPAARCGLATAYEDLAARRAEQSLAARLAPCPLSSVAVSRLLGDGEPAALAARAEQASAAGFVVMKVKVAERGVLDDVARVAAVLAATPRHVRLRLDANLSWTPIEALHLLGAIDAQRIALVEDPFPLSQLEAWRSLREITGVAVAADEPALSEHAVASLAEAGAIDAIVLKPTRLGGPRRAVELGSVARRHGLGVAVTDAIETEIGARTALHVAAALGEPASDVGLGGLALLEAPGLEDAPRYAITGCGLEVAPAHDDPP